MIDTKLIERALALTGKTMEDMEELTEYYATGYDYMRVERGFSIEKFCYYLLSPEFIEKYRHIYSEKYMTKIGYKGQDLYLSRIMIGEAIYEYQSGNEQPFIDLLSNI